MTDAQWGYTASIYVSWSARLLVSITDLFVLLGISCFDKIDNFVDVVLPIN